VLAISGASGLIGRYLCDELLSRGIPFKLFGRQYPSFLVRRDFSFSYYNLFDSSLDLLSSFFEDVDVVVHLAALLPHPRHAISDYYSCNTVAPKKLFDLCSEMGVSKFIYISGSNILRPCDGFIVPESPYSTRLRHPSYLSSKISGELLLLNSKSPVLLSILRPSSVYGFGVRSGLFHNLYRSLVIPTPVTLSSNGLWSADYIYASDVASAILNLVEFSLPGIFNIGSGVSSSIYDVAKVFTSILNLNDDFISLESSQSDENICDSLPIVHIDQAISLLNRHPVSLFEGLIHAIQKYGRI